VQALDSGRHKSSQPRHIKGKWLVDISSAISKSVARCFRSACHGSQGRLITSEGIFHAPQINSAVNDVNFRMSSYRLGTQDVHNLRPSATGIGFDFSQLLADLSTASASLARGPDLDLNSDPVGAFSFFAGHSSSPTNELTHIPDPHCSESLTLAPPNASRFADSYPVSGEASDNYHTDVPSLRQSSSSFTGLRSQLLPDPVNLPSDSFSPGPASGHQDSVTHFSNDLVPPLAIPISEVGLSALPHVNRCQGDPQVMLPRFSADVSNSWASSHSEVLGGSAAAASRLVPPSLPHTVSSPQLGLTSRALQPCGQHLGHPRWTLPHSLSVVSSADNECSADTRQCISALPIGCAAAFNDLSAHAFHATGHHMGDPRMTLPRFSPVSGSTSSASHSAAHCFTGTGATLAGPRLLPQSDPNRCGVSFSLLLSSSPPLVAKGLSDSTCRSLPLFAPSNEEAASSLA